MTDLIQLDPETVKPVDVTIDAARGEGEEARVLTAQRARAAPWFWLMLALAALAVLALLLVGESLSYIRALGATHSALAYVFGVSVVILVLGVMWIVARTVWDYLRIGRMGCTEELSKAIERDPDSAAVCAHVKRIAARYAQHPMPAVRAGVKALYERMRVTETGPDMLAELRAGVLAPLDARVEEIIKTSALQTALGTAISPVAFVDAALVMWRSVVMVRRIAEVYDNRPGALGTWRLMGQVLATVAFAGVAELAADALNQIVGGGLAGRLSGAVGQGLTTGVLVARLGLATRIVCRPLPLRASEARSSLMMFIRSMLGVLQGKFSAE